MVGRCTILKGNRVYELCVWVGGGNSVLFGAQMAVLGSGVGNSGSWYLAGQGTSVSGLLGASVSWHTHIHYYVLYVY